jgi:hypothetical protein
MEKTKTKIKNPRAFSLEDEFMKYDTDDLLYGFMRALSTVRPPLEGEKEHREYLMKKTYQKNKAVIAGVVGVTTRTITNHLNRLAEKGLIDEGIEVINGKDVEVFWFPAVKGRYEILEQDMVRYLIDTKSIHAIKIYIYLLNKYKWKRQKGEKYIFTKEELITALGYSEKTCHGEYYKTINNIIKSFVIGGLIKVRTIKCEIENCDRYKTTERLELDYVVEKYSEIEKLYKNKVEI